MPSEPFFCHLPMQSCEAAPPPGEAAPPFSPLPASHDPLLQIITRISCATEVEIVWSLLREFMASLGFEQLKYGFSPQVQGVNFGETEDFAILSTMPTEFTRIFVERRLYLDNPVMHWCAQNVGVVSWSMVAHLLRTGPPGLEAELADNLSLHQAYGLNAGFSVAFPPTRSVGRGALGVAAPPEMTQEAVDAFLQDAAPLIFAVTSIAHQRLSALPLRRRGRALSRRQREVLEWLAMGKTTGDVATILGLAVPTVEKHLRLAREALGAESTTHALAKASFANQMFAISLPKQP